MIGIAVGVAAVAGVAFGWWGLALTALVLGLARISRAPHISLGTCAVVLATALLGVWRGEGVRHAVSAEANPAGWEEVLVVSAPEQRDRQQFVVIPDPGVGARNGGGSARLCVVAPALPRVGLGDRLRLTGDEQEARDVSDATRLFLGFR